MAQTIDEIKTTAAAIRDATEIGENTASRVGSSVYDLAVYAENTSSTLSPMVQEMYDEFTEARNAYYINLANVFSCVGHLCGSLNTDAIPALKVTDEGEKGYSITLWQDGNTYRGANIPLSSAKNNGLMSAEQADDLATLWDNAVWSEDGKGLSTNDYTDADKANVAKISSIESTADTAASAASANALSISQRASALVLPISGIDELITSVEPIGIIAHSVAYGGLPVYSTKLNAFVVTYNLKKYSSWNGFTDIPAADAYGSAKVLYFDGEKIYRHTGTALVEVTADTSPLEDRIAALEASLKALTGETLITI